MTNYTAVVSGVDGIRKSDEIVLMQASTITPVVFDFIQADATPYIFEAGDVVSGTFVDDVTLEEFSISGTITPATGGNTASWARSVADTGTPAEYRLYMKVTRGGEFDYTEPSPLTILSVPGVGITPPSPLVGVSIVEAAWLTGALATVPDPSDLITSVDVDNKQDKDTDATDGNVAIFDANGQTVDAGFALGTAAQSDIGDFDAAGSAAAAQSFAIQRANHTGTQLLNTILDAGTMASESTSDYYQKIDFSDAPTDDNPLKSNTGGGLRLTGILQIGEDVSPSNVMLVVGDTGNLPSIHAETMAVFYHAGLVSNVDDDCQIAIIGGATGESEVFFGDYDSETAGRLTYDHGDDVMRIIVDETNNPAVFHPNGVSISSSTQPSVINNTLHVAGDGYLSETFGVGTAPVPERGVNVVFPASPASPTTGVYGIRVQATRSTDSTGATGLVGVYSRAYADASINTSMAYYAANGTITSGSIVNNYGLYIQNMTSGTNNYGIYSIGTDSLMYFAGNVGIGKESAAFPLDIANDTNATIRLSNVTTQETAGIDLYNGGTLKWRMFKAGSAHELDFTDGNDDSVLTLGQSQGIGFYGTSPIAQQVLATGAGATVDDIISALQDVGLVKQS